MVAILDSSCDFVCCVQAEERDFFLKILDKAGLKRTQQGAIVLTGREAGEQITIAALTALPRDEIIQLKTVCGDCQKYTLCIAVVHVASYSGSYAAPTHVLCQAYCLPCFFWGLFTD